MTTARAYTKHGLDRSAERGYSDDTFALALADTTALCRHYHDRTEWYSRAMQCLLILPAGDKLRIGQHYRLITAHGLKPKELKRRFSK